MPRNFLILFVFALIVNNFVQTATTHQHSHSHDGSKERVKDGVYQGRDAHHHEGGEHNTEFDHEAILGSVKEAEEFDKLSPEESKKRLAVLITKMDLNKDHFIDRHELEAWILRSLKMLSEEEANDRFDDIDENQDDIVTWQEYARETYGFEDNEIETDPPMYDRPEEETKLITDDKAVFKAADLNKDGVLNREEFLLFQVPEEHPQMLPLILEQTLRDKDTNKDGKIDFQEFVGEAGRNHDKVWLVVEKEKFDNEFDKDKDGVLNGNEILSWVVPSNDEIAKDEVDHLFASTDDNHDNRLSYEEIIHNFETFVGSEATDYGDHLHNIHHFEDEL